MKKILILLCLITVSSFIYADESNICGNEKAIRYSHASYKITITCSYLNQNNTLFRFISGDETHDIIVQGTIPSSYVISWPTNKLMELDVNLSANNTFSVFFDVSSWQVSQKIANVFALNTQKQVVAYSMDNPHVVEISPIFNLSKKILIAQNFSTGFPSLDVYPNKTYFDPENNLVLDFSAGSNY